MLTLPTNNTQKQTMENDQQQEEDAPQQLQQQQQPRRSTRQKERKKDEEASTTTSTTTAKSANTRGKKKKAKVDEPPQPLVPLAPTLANLPLLYWEIWRDDVLSCLQPTDLVQLSHVSHEYSRYVQGDGSACMPACGLPAAPFSRLSRTHI